MLCGVERVAKINGSKTRRVVCALCVCVGGGDDKEVGGVGGTLQKRKKKQIMKTMGKKTGTPQSHRAGGPRARAWCVCGTGCVRVCVRREANT